jgi:rSAM/selenodomain-associated transferase 2
VAATVVRISVVVPTLREAAAIGACVRAARATLPGCEVVVADAGSDDGTREAAADAGAVVLTAPGPRAVAMNAGAARASGDVLLFLHADTALPAGAQEAIGTLVARADGGAFRLAFDEPRPGLALLSRARERLGRVYGDQAIFVTRAAFERLGGFREELPIMEDDDLVRRLRRSGRFEVLPLAVTTSARRHRAHGAVRTVLGIWRIQWLYRAGVSAERLARAYREVR